MLLDGRELANTLVVRVCFVIGGYQASGGGLTQFFEHLKPKVSVQQYVQFSLAVLRKDYKRLYDSDLPHRGQDLFVFLRDPHSRLELSHRQNTADRQDHAIWVKPNSDLFGHP